MTKLIELVFIGGLPQKIAAFC